jgi:hypothetical protein
MKEIYRWLKAANLPAATEGLVIAAQYQALQIKYFTLGCQFYLSNVQCRPGNSQPHCGRL